MFIVLLILIPVSLALSYLFHAPPIWIFLSAGLAIIPLAVWIQRGTEQIAYKSGSSIGGLLNVTFGNAAELIIALFVLSHGSAEVVKGQITGSIIGNSLLGLGLAIVVGTWNRSNLHFNRNQAGQLSTMLVLVLIGLLLPAIYDFNERFLLKAPNAANLDETLSLAVSVVLILLYFANLVYTLYTHSDVFAVEDEPERARWPLWRALLVLILATIFTAWESELVSGALEETAKSLNISTFFLGVIMLALVGNVAEYVSAIYFARQNKMSMSMSITVGATIQVALFVAPVLVLISNLMGSPMNLVFSNPLELIAIAAVAFSVSAISKDGEVDWFEGALLIGLYILIGISIYLVLPA